MEKDTMGGKPMNSKLAQQKSLNPNNGTTEKWKRNLHGL
jgi:hypothetical protein